MKNLKSAAAALLLSGLTVLPCDSVDGYTEEIQAPTPRPQDYERTGLDPEQVGSMISVLKREIQAVFGEGSKVGVILEDENTVIIVIYTKENLIAKVIARCKPVAPISAHCISISLNNVLNSDTELVTFESFLEASQFISMIALD